MRLAWPLRSWKASRGHDKVVVQDCTAMGGSAMQHSASKLAQSVAVVSLLSLAAGCAATVRHNTPSGRPEVTINGRVGEQAATAIMNQMVNSGYSTKSVTSTMLVFEKPVNNILASALLGSHYDSTPAARVTYTIMETESTTRIVTSLAMITNPGSAFERVTPMNNSKSSTSYQEFLYQLKNELEKP